MSGGAKRAAVRSTPEWMDAARRLPEIARTFMQRPVVGGSEVLRIVTQMRLEPARVGSILRPAVA